MFVRLLASFLLVLSLVLAPMGMSTAMAQPAAHAASHGGESPCDQSAPAEDDKAPLHMSCGACIALAAAEPAVRDFAAPPRALPLGKGALRLTGIAPERETPPPRTSPEESL
jgi:hypothetical protein